MFDPKAFHLWLNKRYPQYNPLSINDSAFIDAVSRGNLESMSTYDYDSNKKFFMSQIVEYVQDNSAKGKVAFMFVGIGLGFILFGLISVMGALWLVK